MKFIHYIPILTTILAIFFSSSILRRYLRKGKGLHLLWWAIGVVLFGIGTFIESMVTLYGWNEILFRFWYISGALLGGAPLAQGTVYLLLRRRTAHTLTIILLPVLIIASFCVCITPINYELVNREILSGKVIAWRWVRMFSPFINIYALVFLAGGAALSAYRFSKKQATYHRFIGNVLITIGAVLPAIGGASSRFGHTEVLYVTEFLGLVLIYLGYLFNIRGKN